MDSIEDLHNITLEVAIVNENYFKNNLYLTKKINSYTLRQIYLLGKYIGFIEIICYDITYKNLEKYISKLISYYKLEGKKYKDEIENWSRFNILYYTNDISHLLKKMDENDSNIDEVKDALKNISYENDEEIIYKPLKQYNYYGYISLLFIGLCYLLRMIYNTFPESKLVKQIFYSIISFMISLSALLFVKKNKE